MMSGFLAFFILLFSFKSWSVSTHAGCVLTKEKTRIYFSEDKTEYIPVNRNQIFPYLEFQKTLKLYKITYMKKEYWIPSNKVITGGKHLCSVEPKCFTIRKPAQIFIEPDVSSKVIGDLGRNSEMDWFGQNYISVKEDTHSNSIASNADLNGSVTTSELPESVTISSATVPSENVNLKTQKKVNWFQIKVGEQYGWVEASIGKLEDYYCGSSFYNKEKRWNFDIEYGSQTQVTSSVYDALITSVAEPNDVACLQDPLVTKIELGAGQRYGVNFDYLPLDWLMLRWGLHYEQVQFKLKGKSNPHPDPGKTSCVLIPKKMSELDDTTQIISENNLVMPFGSYLKYNMFRQHSLLIGGSINVVNNMLPHFVFNFYKGDTLSKQTLSKITISPSQIRYTNEYELRYLYRLPLTDEYSLGLSVYYKFASNKANIYGIAVHL